MYRILELYSQMEYNMGISQMLTMLARNYTVGFGCLATRSSSVRTDQSWHTNLESSGT